MIFTISTDSSDLDLLRRGSKLLRCCSFELLPSSARLQGGVYKQGDD